MMDWNAFSVGNHRVACPLCARNERDKTAGLKVDLDGRSVLHCFRCAHIETRAGRPTARNVPILALRHTALSDWAVRLWSECRPIDGIAAEYLRARVCVIPPSGAHLRWHPALKHPSGHVGPALVGLVTNVVTGKALSLHRTWITSTGKASVRPAKLLLAHHEVTGGCIRLWPDIGPSTRLGIAEGIETALTLAWALCPVWAALDAGHLERFPVIEGVRTLIIARDQDAAGNKAATVCARRWAAAGREVLLTNQTANDLNDVVQQVRA